ncbi:hypothetical protein OPV22_002460 [Ensete ventricosum]|uniref:Uncharacterized protein n=1 Tax=Ensete ventricosum TaxID=4639 RepID=A0AAV8RXY5_ENSVE|nr:hypothetical protein OPV22_002460 [Ensete ventricosum]
MAEKMAGAEWSAVTNLHSETVTYRAGPSFCQRPVDVSGSGAAWRPPASAARIPRAKLSERGSLLFLGLSLIARVNPNVDRRRGWCCPCDVRGRYIPLSVPI